MEWLADHPLASALPNTVALACVPSAAYEGQLARARLIEAHIAGALGQGLLPSLAVGPRFVARCVQSARACSLLSLGPCRGISLGELALRIASSLVSTKCTCQWRTGASALDSAASAIF